MSDAPSPDATPRGTPAQRPGAARGDAVPRMETVRITEPDLLRRRALERSRNRLVYTAFGFGLLFLAVIAKHFTIDRDKVQIKLDRGETVSTLEIDVEVPSLAKMKVAAPA